MSYDFFGETRVVPLEPGGSGTAVTGANRERYVARLVEWTLDESVDEQFGAFAQGFHQVRMQQSYLRTCVLCNACEIWCSEPNHHGVPIPDGRGLALSLLRHEELELRLSGIFF